MIVKPISIAILLLLSFTKIILPQSYDLQLRLDQNDQTIGGNYQITVQMKAVGNTFEMGSSNLVFTYNTDAFETGEETSPPVLSDVFNFSGGNYNEMTLTDPALGKLSINIDLAGESNGTIVPQTLTDIAAIRFTIKAPQETGQFTWQTEPPNHVVVFDDDQSSLLPANRLAGESTFLHNSRVFWNLVGLPNDAPDKHYLTLFPNADPNTLFRYEGSYALAETLAFGEGYWLRFPEAGTSAITGFDANCIAINLNDGWNIISGPSCKIAVEDIEDSEGIIMPGSFFGFEGSYFSADTMFRGMGYWVNTSQAGQVVLNCGTSGAGSKARKINAGLFAQIDLNAISSLQLSDAAGNSQTLYFDAEIEKQLAEQSFRLPPIPPANASTFDARFSGDFRLTQKTDAIILLQASQYPISIYPQNLTIQNDSKYILRGISGNKEVANYVLIENETIEIHDPRVNKLQLSKIEATNIPEKFIVHQNYPNPFNPATTIRYGLPSAQKISIVIFNTLGQKVRTLVNGRREAGFHTVTWNAANDIEQGVASGIYLFRFSTEEHSAVKKVIYLK